MAKILAFSTARKAAPASPVNPPTANAARLWIEQRKVGASQAGATTHANTVARLLGHADLDRCPWHTLGYVDIARLRGRLLTLVADGTYTPASANVYLSAAKSIMRQVWLLGADSDTPYLSADGLRRIEAIRSVPGQKQRRGHRRLSDAEVVTLLAHCAADRTPRGARDAAIVAVGVACGLRASEHAALQLADYDAEGGRLRIPQIKVEVSEGDVWLPLPPEACAYLDKWLAWRGRLSGALFTRLERGGLGVIQEMTPDAITEIVKARAEECGVGHVTAHDLRATCLTRFLEHTSDALMGSKLARHLSLATIKLYDKRDAEDLRRMVARVPWPGDGESG